MKNTTYTVFYIKHLDRAAIIDFVGHRPGETFDRTLKWHEDRYGVTVYTMTSSDLHTAMANAMEAAYGR